MANLFNTAAALITLKTHNPDDFQKLLKDAIVAQNLPAMASILAAGADPNGRYNGLPLLHFAIIQNNRTDVTRMLLAAGADPNARDVEEGFDPTTRYLAGKSALHEAVLNNKPDHAILCLAAGADPNAKTDAGLTPLHVAASHGCILIVDPLVKEGADPNAKTIAGDTPSHLAASRGEINVVRALIENGAWLDARNNEGQTAGMIADNKGYSDIKASTMPVSAERPACANSISAVRAVLGLK